eukprot:97507_1
MSHSDDQLGIVVPLSKKELILGGGSILAIVSIGFIFEIWMDTIISSHEINSITNSTDLIDFGQYIKSTSTAQIAQMAVFIFIFPLLVLYYIAVARVLKICFAEYHVFYTIFSLGYIFYAIFIYVAISVGILFQAFFWSIDDATTDITLPSANMALLLMYRFEIVLVSLSIYFAAIAMVSFWSTFVLALFFDSKYNTNLRVYILPSLCFKIQFVAKLCLILLAIFTLFGSYFSVYAWNPQGFWSLSGQSQIFQIFTICSYFISGLWLLWFGSSKNYQKFNDRLQFKQFI